jgi:hypothetical protein
VRVPALVRLGGPPEPVQILVSGLVSSVVSPPLVASRSEIPVLGGEVLCDDIVPVDLSAFSKDFELQPFEFGLEWVGSEPVVWDNGHCGEFPTEDFNDQMRFALDLASSEC